MTKTKPDFIEFPKMARLSRDCIITEKLDGTNAQVYITEFGEIFFGSRSKWITPEDDNYGFAKWGMEHKEELMTLGTGSHFGEWWGQGIQRNYWLKEKRFSLFNVTRWCLSGFAPAIINKTELGVKMQDVLPACVSLVPKLFQGLFSDLNITRELECLKLYGSKAAPGFMNPEGIVVYHIAAKVGFKKTIEKDEEPKSKYVRL